MEGFTLDRNLLETGEVQRILAGLRSLQAVYPSQGVAGTIDKFSAALARSREKGIACPEGEVFVELTPSRRERRSTIDLVQRSIREKGPALHELHRRGQRARDGRTVEPAALVYSWQAWYVWAWCRLRGDWRLFKVSRMRGATLTADARKAPPTDLSTRPCAHDWEGSPFLPVHIRVSREARNQVEESWTRTRINGGRPTVPIRARPSSPVDDWVRVVLDGLAGVTVTSSAGTPMRGKPRGTGPREIFEGLFPNMT
jgi:predicted DNA-binding transcriptional regulator YafY